MFRLKLGRVHLQWDRKYGCTQRTGWTILIDGCVCAELEKYFVVAVFKSFYKFWFVWEH